MSLMYYSKACLSIFGLMHGLMLVRTNAMTGRGYPRVDQAYQPRLANRGPGKCRSQWRAAGLISVLAALVFDVIGQWSNHSTWQAPEMIRSKGCFTAGLSCCKRYTLKNQTQSTWLAFRQLSFFPQIFPGQPKIGCCIVFFLNFYYYYFFK